MLPRGAAQSCARPSSEARCSWRRSYSCMQRTHNCCIDISRRLWVWDVSKKGSAVAREEKKKENKIKKKNNGRASKGKAIRRARTLFWTKTKKKESEKDIAIDISIHADSGHLGGEGEGRKKKKIRCGGERARA